MLRLVVCRTPPGIVVYLCIRPRILLKKKQLRNLAYATAWPLARLKMKNDLEIEVRKRALVLKLHRVYRLEDLLKRMTPRNVHKAIDFGLPMGREAL